MKIIEKQWISYRDKLIPADAPAVQIRESKRAFYAGAMTLFLAVTAGLSKGPDPEDSDMAMMDSIDAEIKAYVKDIAEGRA